MFPSTLYSITTCTEEGPSNTKNLNNSQSQKESGAFKFGRITIGRITFGRLLDRTSQSENAEENEDDDEDDEDDEDVDAATELMYR